MTNDWISVGSLLPKDGVEVLTKIDDERGCRNEAKLRRQGNLWFIPGDCNNPGHAMYVYYTPTHWGKCELL